MAQVSVELHRCAADRVDVNNRCGGLVSADYDRESTVAPETLTPTENSADHAAADTVAEATVDGAAAPLVEDELLVEEVSIDGMCGVY